MMQDLDLRVPAYQSELYLLRADDIKIGEIGPVMSSPSSDVVELAAMKLGFPPPPGRKGGSLFNFRSQGRHFGQSGRCLVPASAFFEFTGSKYSKAKHRSTLNGAAFTAISGSVAGKRGKQSSVVHDADNGAGHDVPGIHSRQIVVPRPEDRRHWLELTKKEAELLRHFARRAP